jgi:hypothetical protein
MVILATYYHARQGGVKSKSLIRLATFLLHRSIDGGRGQNLLGLVAP